MATVLILINGVRKIGAKYQHDKQIQQVTTIDRCFVNRVLGNSFRSTLKWKLPLRANVHDKRQARRRRR